MSTLTTTLLSIYLDFRLLCVRCIQRRVFLFDFHGPECQMQDYHAGYHTGYHTGYHKDIRRVEKYYHATLKFIFNKRAGAPRGRNRCEICCDGATWMSVQCYDICVRCDQTSNDIYKHAYVPALATRARSPRPDHLVILSTYAREALAALSQYIPVRCIMSTGYYCQTCLRGTCLRYIIGVDGTVLSLCKECVSDVAARILTMQRKNTIIHACVYVYLDSDTAMYVLELCARVYAGHTDKK